ncbi:I78 family peptidase inhibitor [Streptomyces sp. YGL11-2]|uniref:I78 family peptidase inhibitor n=1 Tax=Streptomyces sp. YGL11-2 TaxID=3414028 RepID=UPI003CEC5C0E
MAPVPNLPGDRDDIQDEVEAYVGLGRQEAEERARARGWTTVRALPPGAVITMEYLTGRINFEVRDGVVHRSWQG